MCRALRVSVPCVETRGFSRYMAAKKKSRRAMSEEAVGEQVARVEVAQARGDARPFLCLTAVSGLQHKAQSQAVGQVYLPSLGDVADDYLPGVTPGLAKR